jgi:heparin binding hemagglutinin HbhA
MAITTADIKKTLTDPTPLYAVAGAGDLLVEKIREIKVPEINVPEINVPEIKVPEIKRPEVKRPEFKVDPKAVQDKVQERLSELRAELKNLPERANVAVSDSLSQASKTYDDLAVRGKSVVSRIRDQKATQELIEQAESTVAKARQARRTATGGAKSTTKAAKKTAAEAKKTVAAAGDAVDAAASKVGD